MKSALSLTSLFLILSFHLSVAYGQNESCATNFAHQMRMQTDTAYLRQFQAYESGLDSIIQHQGHEKVQSTIYTIPVVVHVIHLGEAIGTGSNISDFQIQEAIRGLNERFRHMVDSGVDVEIEFCLASTDPNGNPTNGINRVDGSGIPNYQANGMSYYYSNCNAGDETDLKDLSRWPVSDYYNIWTVNMICQGFGGVIGFAYYPNGNDYDGTVVAAHAMDYYHTILTHEIGHGFSVYHTFEGDGGNSYCPADSPCSGAGDHICDTQPHKQYDCGTTNPCNGSGLWDNSVYNYMSYCGVGNRFTQDQKTRLRAAAAGPYRASLLNSPACLPVSREEKIHNEIFSVWPNPAHNSFEIDLHELPGGELEISDLLGKVVHHWDILNSGKKFRIETLPKGIYLVKATTGSQTYCRKLIID